MSIFLNDLTHQGSALDDILLMSNYKQHILQIIKQTHDIANRGNLKLAPEKPCFMLLTAKQHGNVNRFTTTEPTLSQSAAIHKIPS